MTMMDYQSPASLKSFQIGFKNNWNEWKQMSVWKVENQS